MRSALIGAAVVAVATTAGAIAPDRVAAQFPTEVRGTVLDARTGLPVASALVSDARGTLSTVADPGGGFVLRGILPGTQVLRVEALGYEPAQVPVEVERGRAARIRVLLEPRPIELGAIDARVRGGALPVGALVLGRERIEESGARDLGELLTGLAGVVVTRRGGPGAPALPSIRGSAPDEVLVLVDGVPINSLITGEADLSLVSLSGVERVVVVPGAESARYGAGALAGVILVEGRSAAEARSELSSAIGAWGERRVEGTSGGRIAEPGIPLDLLVAGEWRTNQGAFTYERPVVRGGGRARRGNADSEHLSLTVGLEVGDLLDLRGEWTDLTRGMPGSIVQPAESARQEQERWGLSARARGRWEGEVGLGTGEPILWSLRADLQRQSARFRDPDPPFVQPYDDEVRVRTSGVEGGVEGALGTTRWSVGADAREWSIRSTTLTAAAPDGLDAVGIRARIERSWDLPLGWQGTLAPSLRLDRHSRVQGSTLSGRLVLAADRPGWSLGVEYGSAFAPPTLADQFFQEGVFVQPNPELEPERVRDEVELSVAALPRSLGSLGWAGPLSVEARAALFRSDVEGMILWLPNHRFVWRPENFDVRRFGGEVDGALGLEEAGLRVEGSVSWVEVEYDEPSLAGQVIYRPGLTGVIGLRLDRGPFRARLVSRYTGERRTTPGSSTNLLEPFWRTDLDLGWGFTPAGWSADLRLSIDNLFDDGGAMLIDYPFPGRGWGFEIRLAPPAPLFHQPS